MKIALLQIAAQDTLDGTLDKGILFCRKAKGMGADIALFPEMFSNGYNIYGRPVSDWIREAIPADHAFVRAFQALSNELNMAIGITLLEECETGIPANMESFARRGSGSPLSGRITGNKQAA